MLVGVLFSVITLFGLHKVSGRGSQEHGDTSGIWCFSRAKIVVKSNVPGAGLLFTGVKSRYHTMWHSKFSMVSFL